MSYSTIIVFLEHLLEKKYNKLDVDKINKIIKILKYEKKFINNKENLKLIKGLIQNSYTVDEIVHKLNNLNI